jgi:hypothetical protein
MGLKDLGTLQRGGKISGAYTMSVVGSSRDGAVAMNLKIDVPLVLLWR